MYTCSQMLQDQRFSNLCVANKIVEGLFWKSYSLAAAPFFSKYLQL